MHVFFFVVVSEGVIWEQAPLGFQGDALSCLRMSICPCCHLCRDCFWLWGVGGPEVNSRRWGGGQPKARTGVPLSGPSCLLPLPVAPPIFSDAQCFPKSSGYPRVVWVPWWQNYMESLLDGPSPNLLNQNTQDWAPESPLTDGLSVPASHAVNLDTLLFWKFDFVLGVMLLLLLSCFSRVRLFATHGLQPTRLFRQWEFPGKSARVGCHCLLCLGHKSS